MIRRARPDDVPEIVQTYEELLMFEKENGSYSNWQLNIYPTAQVPESKIPAGSMFVLEEAGDICASMALDHEQAKEYAFIPWLYEAEAEQVLVIHTLCIPPSKSGRGYASQMIDFAKSFAKEKGCTVIRIDTYLYNEPAKALYKMHGFRIAGYAESLLQGLIFEKQVYLEYRL